MAFTLTIPFSIPKVSVALAAGYALWVLLAGTVKMPAWLLRQILYSHTFPVWLGQNLDKPESFGFLRNQITQLSIPVEGGSNVFAWLVTPLKIYAKHEAAFQQNTAECKQALAIEKLAEDPDSRLIIYCESLDRVAAIRFPLSVSADWGNSPWCKFDFDTLYAEELMMKNAGTVGQPKRTDAYRMLSSIDSNHTFVLAFDYRGFGRTQGSPTEEGVLADAIAVVRWALETGNVPSRRIVFVSQSLGTAIASATASHFIDQTPKIEFGGIILCAPFVDAPTAFQNYSIAGIVPLLAPLRVLPPLRRWFVRQFPDPWKTSDRTRNLVRKSNRLRLTIVHATNDMTIPPSQTDELFYMAVEATPGASGLTKQEIDQRKATFDLGDGGWTHSWIEGDKVIRKDIVLYGGHNTIMKWAPVSLAVARTFDLEE